MEDRDLAFSFHEVDVDVAVDFAKDGSGLVVPVGKRHEVGAALEDLHILLFVLHLLVFGFIRVLRCIDCILVHLGVHIVRVSERTVFNVEEVQVCDLDQVVANQAQVLHVIRLQKVLLYDIVCITLSDVSFVD